MMKRNATSQKCPSKHKSQKVALSLTNAQTILTTHFLFVLSLILTLNDLKQTLKVTETIRLLQISHELANVSPLLK